MPEEHNGLLIRAFKTRRSFETWVDKNHAKREDGLWVKFAKKASGLSSITYEEAREVALIYGWIDGLKNALDDQYYAIRFTPRRPRSKWSRINRDIVEALLEENKLHPAGLAQVEAAKADGRWDNAYLGQADIKPPADFKKALAKSPKAKKAWPTIKSASRYHVLYQIEEAKRPETRARRITKFILMLEAGDLP